MYPKIGSADNPQSAITAEPAPHLVTDSKISQNTKPGNMVTDQNRPKKSQNTTSNNVVTDQN